MKHLETFMNWLTEMDWGWWPLLSLRPAREAYITNRILSQLSVVYGAALALVTFLLVASWHHEPISVFRLMVVPILGFIVFFILYKFSFAYFWNRRASRLRSGIDENVPAGS